MDTSLSWGTHVGAIAGIIAFLWKAFEYYASKSKAAWDDQVVKIVEEVVSPLVKALDSNTAVTADNSDKVVENSAATKDNSEATAPKTGSSANSDPTNGAQ